MALSNPYDRTLDVWTSVCVCYSRPRCNRLAKHFCEQRSVAIRATLNLPVTVPAPNLYDNVQTCVDQQTAVLRRVHGALLRGISPVQVTEVQAISGSSQRVGPPGHFTIRTCQLIANGIGRCRVLACGRMRQVRHVQQASRRAAEYPATTDV